MIRHILTIIWNERQANAWIVLEFFVVFCVLWFCVDYLSFSGRLFAEPLGYDVEHVYLLNLSENETSDDIDHDTKYEIINNLINRVRQYPGIETISISKGAMPYSRWSMKSSFKVNGDTLYLNMDRREITPEFFDVFKIPFIKGKAFENDPNSHLKQVVAGAARNGKFGSYPDEAYMVTDINTIRKDSTDYTVVGWVEPMKGSINTSFFSNVFFPLTKENTQIGDIEITFRVSPAADINFKERFTKEMAEGLSITPFTFQSITPMTEKADGGKDWFIKENLRSLIAISAFLIANIFLGIIGTFWSRIQSRRSEIGLRIALGSSKRKVQLMMFAETVFMLFIVSVPAAYICLNLGQTQFLESFGIPAADRVMVGAGWEQDIINYLGTFGLLTLISGLAVWYPARLSTNVPPAEALRDE